MDIRRLIKENLSTLAYRAVHVPYQYVEMNWKCAFNTRKTSLLNNRGAFVSKFVSSLYVLSIGEQLAPPQIWYNHTIFWKSCFSFQFCCFFHERFSFFMASRSLMRVNSQQTPFACLRVQAISWTPSRIPLLLQRVQYSNTNFIRYKRSSYGFSPSHKSCYLEVQEKKKMLRYFCNKPYHLFSKPSKTRIHELFAKTVWFIFSSSRVQKPTLSSIRWYSAFAEEVDFSH